MSQVARATGLTSACPSPRPSRRGHPSIPASPSRRTRAPSCPDLLLPAGGRRNLLAAAALLLALGLGRLAELLELHHLTGGRPIPVGNVANNHPDSDAGLWPPARCLEDQLGGILSDPGLSAVAERSLRDGDVEDGVRFRDAVGSLDRLGGQL